MPTLSLRRTCVPLFTVAVTLMAAVPAFAQRTREEGQERRRPAERNQDRNDGKPSATVPDRTENGATLVVPAEEASKGKVYYVLSGRDNQINFESDAPLEKIEGTSNEVVGYVVVAEKEGQPFDIVAGAFRLPVASLKTGIPQRDEHLRGGQWLDAGGHPDITYSITNVTKPKEAKAEDEFATYTARIIGMMTIRGAEHRVIAPSRLTLMPESDKTRAQAPGDLMAIRSTFRVKLKDYDVDVAANANAKGKVSNDIAIDLFLTLSTAMPEASGGSTAEAQP